MVVGCWAPMIYGTHSSDQHRSQTNGQTVVVSLCSGPFDCALVQQQSMLDDMCFRWNYQANMFHRESGRSNTLAAERDSNPETAAEVMISSNAWGFCPFMQSPRPIPRSRQLRAFGAACEPSYQLALSCETTSLIAMAIAQQFGNRKAYLLVPFGWMVFFKPTNISTCVYICINVYGFVYAFILI